MEIVMVQELRRQRCATCGFWNADGSRVTKSEGGGTCQRHAPAPKGHWNDEDGEHEVLFTYWPETHESDFCGEWARKPE